MFSIPIHTLELRAAFMDVLARHRDSQSYATREVCVGQRVMVGAGRITRQRDTFEMASSVQPINAGQFDLAALATAFAQRLHEADVVMATATQIERYTASLALTTPRSRRSLYLTTRAIFVTDLDQVATFNRVFGEVFGEPAGADRYRESETARVLAHA